MTFTFSPALTTSRDKVRQKIGDTKSVGHQIEDETIDTYLNVLTVPGTARQLCLDLAAKWAGVADITVDDQMQRISQVRANYLALAERFRLEDLPATAASVSFPRIMVGGIGDCRGPLDDPCCDTPYLYHHSYPR